MDSDLAFLTIADASRLIAAKTLSPVELIEAKLARIAELDESLNSFLLLTADTARAEARRAEAEIAKGEWRGPLHGIPIGLKDIYCTEGVRTTALSFPPKTGPLFLETVRRQVLWDRLRV